MARKKQEIALQTVIETQEEWEEMLAKEGVHVVDIYQEWAGPCKAMINNFKRLKNELGDDLLHFEVAKSDTIDALERYRGKCQPCYLFFAGGSLVAVVRGANSPLLLKTITEQLAHEHKVLDGSAERTEIRDGELGDVDTGDPQQDDDDDEDDDDGEEKDYTVAIIKPNVVKAGKSDEVIEMLQQQGIDILDMTERTLTEEEATDFYKDSKDEEHFELMIKYMTSGPCKVLALAKGDKGIIDDWRNMLGPPSVEEAKENNPDSLRAKYGEENYANGLHGSDSKDTAARELAFFFPNLTVPKSKGAGKKKKSGGKSKVQRTLALIRPDAMRDRKDEILGKITEAGFSIALQKEVHLSKAQAEEFYSEHQGQEYFEELTNRMSSGPLLALALAREDAISDWREMLGPKEVATAKEEAPDSLRAQFSVEDCPINQLHGSDTPESANKEIEYFFPMQQTVAVVKPDAYQTKEEIMKRIKEAGFNIAARKETEISQDMAEQLYSDHKDKEYFGDLAQHMTSGPTLFMVLSREDAVEGWRSLIGSTDPEKAKEENPDSIRAQFGQNIKENAVHGSSNPESAKQTMKLVFGDMEFNPDGTVKGGEREEQAATEASRPATQQGADEQQGDDSQQQQEQQQQQGEDDGQEKPQSPQGDEKEAEQEAEQQDAGEEQQTTEETKEEEKPKSPEPAEDDGKKSPEQKEDGGEQAAEQSEQQEAEKEEEAKKDEDKKSETGEGQKEQS